MYLDSKTRFPLISFKKITCYCVLKKGSWFNLTLKDRPTSFMALNTFDDKKVFYKIASFHTIEDAKTFIGNKLGYEIVKCYIPPFTRYWSGFIGTPRLIEGLASHKYKVA